MYTSIVVPLDGSAFGKRALPVALALAHRSNAAVHLVHVHEPVVYARGAPMYDTRLDHELRQAMRTELTALAAQLTRETTLDVNVVFIDGPVVPTLRQHLTGQRPDLVVMMTHGRSGLSRAWLGSVAEGVVRSAPVPVLLVRSGVEWPGNLIEPLFRRVLVPLDGSATAEEVLDHAISLGTTDTTVYALLTVVVPLPTLAHPYPSSESFIDQLDVERQRTAALEYLERAAAELHQAGARVETAVVVNEHPARGILGHAEATDVDLIALSTHGHGAALHRLSLGSVADKIVRGATVPLLVCRSARAHAVFAEAELQRGACLSVGPPLTSNSSGTPGDR